MTKEQARIATLANYPDAYRYRDSSGVWKVYSKLSQFALGTSHSEYWAWRAAAKQPKPKQE